MQSIVIPAQYLCIALGLASYSGLFFALLLGIRMHFTQLLQTHCQTAEYWPSISSTIGDFMPERGVWRFVACVSIPMRVALVYCLFNFFKSHLASKGHGNAEHGAAPRRIYMVLFLELIRVGALMGWSFVASFENLFFHETAFALYMLTGFFGQIVQVTLCRKTRSVIANGELSYKLKIAGLVGQTTCAMLVVMFFINHNRTCAPGAYSRSTMCEWGFAFFNVAFDLSQWFEFEGQSVAIGSNAQGGAHAVVFSSFPSKAALWVTDVFWGYFFFASIIHMWQSVYFIPMVAMSFTPEVAMILAPLVTIVVYWRVAMKWLLRPAFGTQIPGYVFCYGISLISLFNFDVTKNAGMKLLVLGLGPIFYGPAMFARVTLLTAVATSKADVENPEDTATSGDRERLVATDKARIIFGFPLGLLLCMIYRIQFVSLDPVYVWPALNIFFGLVPGAFATITVLRQHLALAPAIQKLSDPLTAPATLPAAQPSPIVTGVFFGSLTTMSFVLVLSPGIIPRYVAYDPYPASILVVLAFVIGLVLANRAFSLYYLRKGTRTLITPLMIGVALVGGTIALYYGTTQSNRMFEKVTPTHPATWWGADLRQIDVHDWYAEERSGSQAFAFCGGLVVVCAIGCLWPSAMDVCFYQRLHPTRNPTTNGGSVLGSFETISFGTTAALLIGYVYTVVFPFVPGGFYLRDRMDITLIGNALCIVLPLLVIARKVNTGFEAQSAELPSTVLRVMCALFLVGIVWREMGAAEIRDVNSENIITNSVDYANWTEIYSKVALSAANDVTDPHLKDFEIEAIRRRNNFDLEETRKLLKAQIGEKAASIVEDITPISGLIWTIHYGLDNFGVDSFERLTRKVESTGAGIIGILESDTTRVMNGNRDIVEYLAYTLGYSHSDFGISPLDSSFGCALITKYPIISSMRYVLPSPVGELACLIHAKVDIHGSITNVYVGHWGNTEHEYDRRLQSMWLGHLVVTNPGPSMFLGYLVTDPGKDNYKYMANQAGKERLFRDPAWDLRYEIQWRHLEDYGGDLIPQSELEPEARAMRLVDQQYKRRPPGKKPLTYYYPHSHRFTNAHPYLEYVDRYCQYILYKPGVMSTSEQLSMRLFDWFRILDVDELSDTEIQVVQFVMGRARGVK